MNHKHLFQYRVKEYDDSTYILRWCSCGGIMEEALILPPKWYKIGRLEPRENEKHAEIVQEESVQATDPLFGEAKAIVQKCKKASTSLLQRELKCTYVKSATLIDQLEAHGIIGPKDGAKPRKVL